MNRKLIGGLLAVVLVLVAVWFLWLRDRGAPGASGTADKARTAGIKVSTTPPADKPDDKAAPRGRAPKWTLDTDPDGPLRLEGQVLGPDGKGVGGAQVWIASVPPRSTKSDDDGSFSFDKLVGRTYYLSATSGDLIGGTDYKLTDKGDPVVIRLTEGAAVNVTVLDDAAKPIEGAELKHDEEHTTKTNAQGKGTLKPVRPGFVAVTAKAPGYAPNTSFTTVGSAGATGEIKIVLRKGFAVSGRVIDEAGKPIAKVKVHAAGGVWDVGGDREDDGGLTDDKGQFQIAALAAGSHTLLAVDGEHAPAESKRVEVADRPVTGIEITMKAGGVVGGVVIDTEQKPVPFATVRISGNANDPRGWSVASRQATTDKDGTFELRGLSRAKMQARAESDTAASKIVDFDLSDKAAVKDVKLVLDVAGQIAGIVVDEKGAPVPEVQVHAFPDILGGASTEGLALAGMSSATTDGAGAFVIHGVPDGAYRLWAARSATGQQEFGQTGTPAKSGDKAVKITLPAPGGLVGKVVIEGVGPPKFVNVQLGVSTPTPASNGEFQIKEANPGTYDVTFRSPEFAELIKRDIKIESGKTTDLGTVTVNRGRKLTGKVVDGSGTPVSGAKIKVGDMLISSQGNEDQAESFEDMFGIRSAISDADGTFTIIGVPTKTSTMVMADHPDLGRSLPASLPISTDDPPPLTLTLRGYGAISGTVMQKGKPVADVTISEASKGGGAQASFAKTAADGTFHMAKVPEGDHVLQAMQQQMMSMKTTSATVKVTAGKTAAITIDIPSGQLTLAVHIKEAPNNKVNAAQVFLFNGVVAFANGKQIVDGLFQGGNQGMKFWLGAGLPDPEFDELVAGDYSVCAIPITGDMSDQKFMQRLQENVQFLKVYCKPTKVTATPLKQTFVEELPAMSPLPEPTK